MCKYMMDGLYYMCDHLDAARRPSLGRGSPAPKTPRRKRRACNETLRTIRRMRMMSGLAGVSRLVPARFPAPPLPRSPAPPLPRPPYPTARMVLGLGLVLVLFANERAQVLVFTPHTPAPLPHRAAPGRAVSCRVVPCR
jgi:hypothetical protein